MRSRSALAARSRDEIAHSSACSILSGGSLMRDGLRQVWITQAGPAATLEQSIERASVSALTTDRFLSACHATDTRRFHSRRAAGCNGCRRSRDCADDTHCRQKQQRFFSSASEIIGVRSQLRDAADILASDIRGASVSSLGLPVMTDTAVELYTTIASSVACGLPVGGTIGLPPSTLVTGHTLTSILTQPDTGDIASIYVVPPTYAGLCSLGVVPHRRVRFSLAGNVVSIIHRLHHTGGQLRRSYRLLIDARIFTRT